MKPTVNLTKFLGEPVYTGMVELQPHLLIALCYLTGERVGMTTKELAQFRMDCWNTSDNKVLDYQKVLIVCKENFEII